MSVGGCCSNRHAVFQKKPTLSIFLLSLPFFVAIAVTSAVLTRQQYNTDAATDWVIVGALDSDSVTFKIRTPDVDSNPRTITVSTSPDEADAGSVVYAQQLEGTGPVEQITVSGLVNGTEHYYFIGSTSTASSTTNTSADTTTTTTTTSDIDGSTQTQIIRRGKFRTPQPEGTRFNFTVATAGCAVTGTRASLFRHIAADDPLLFLHLGDFHYEDLNVDDVNIRIGAIDRVMGSSPQADLFGSVGFTSMWDDHDWLGDESRGYGVGREAALESYRVAFPYHGPLPASLIEAYEGQENIPPYHAFTIGTVRFLISDLRSEATDQRMYSPEQKQWLFDEISKASAYDFVVWVTPSFWIGKAEKDDTWLGHPEERSELSDFITSTIGGADGPQNLIALSSDAHMVGFDDGRNTYYGTSAMEEGMKPDGIYSFPILQSGPMDRMGSAKGGPYSDGCYTMSYQRNFQYSTLGFEFGEKGDDKDNDEGACIDIKSYSVSDSSDSSTREVIFSKRLCGKIFNSIEGAGTGSCDAEYMSSGNLTMVVLAAVFGLVGIGLSFCSGVGKCLAAKMSLAIILSYFLSYLLGIGVPYLMGAYGNFDIMPVAAISLAQMFTLLIYLFCWRKRLKASGQSGEEGDDDDALREENAKVLEDEGKNNNNGDKRATSSSK